MLRVADYCKPGIKVHYFIDSNQQLDEWATICYGQMKRLYKENKDAFICQWATAGHRSEERPTIAAADLRRMKLQTVRRGRNLFRKYKLADEDFLPKSTSEYAAREDFWMFDSVRFWLARKEVPEAIGDMTNSGLIEKFDAFVQGYSLYRTIDRKARERISGSVSGQSEPGETRFCQNQNPTKGEKL